MLKKITICQNTVCQNKGSKAILQRLESLYEEKYKAIYPQLRIERGDCLGDCEQGPIVRVNDAIFLRNVNNQQIQQLLDHPEEVLGTVQHVREQDREIFERILGG